MEVFGKLLLDECKTKHSDVRGQLDAWVAEVERSTWEQPLDVAQRYPKGRPISNDRVVFDIKGGKYRLVVRVDYERKWVEIRFCGTHHDYDKRDATAI